MTALIGRISTYICLGSWGDHPAKKLWKEGFTFVRASDVIADPKLIPPHQGVYGLFFKSGDRLLAESGYSQPEIAELWMHEGYEHLYTGETYRLRERILQHLSGDVFGSNLRETLLAIEATLGVTSGELIVTDDQDATEAALTRWLGEEVFVAYKACHYAKEVERYMLQWAASPLNIGDRQRTPYANLLSNLKHRFRTDRMANWTKRTRLPRRRH